MPGIVFVVIRIMFVAFIVSVGGAIRVSCRDRCCWR